MTERVTMMAQQEAVQGFDDTETVYQDPSTQLIIKKKMQSKNLQQSSKKAKKALHNQKDLGFEVFAQIRECYFSVNKMWVSDKEILYKFWKMNHDKELKKQQREEENNKLQEKIYDKKLQHGIDPEKSVENNPNSWEVLLPPDSKLGEEQRKVKEKNQRILQIYLENKDDILLTLQNGQVSFENMHKHEKEFKQKEEEQLNEESNKLIQEQKKKQWTKQQESIQKLIQKKNQQVDEQVSSQEIKKTDTEEEKKQKQKQEQKTKRKEFVNYIINLHKMEFPEKTYFRTVENLFTYWEQIEDKADLQLDKEEEDVQFDLQEYFHEVIEDFVQNFKRKKGYECYDTFQLMKYWKQLPKEDRIKQDVNFESQKNLQDLIDEYLYKKFEEQNQEEEDQDIDEEREKNKFERLKNLVLNNKEIKATDIETLSRPRDNNKKGKKLLLLQKFQPGDKIIEKLIAIESKDIVKPSKDPLEYEVFDESEENKVKEREIEAEPQIRGRKYSIQEQEQNKTQTQALARIFEDQISVFYSSQMDKIRKEKERGIELKKQEKLMMRYLEQQAVKYLQFRSRRFEEKVPTVNQFLSQTYREILREYYQATRHNFPYKKWGQSYQLKQKSYPLSLKRKFFDIVRQYVITREGECRKDAVRKLPFWAPPSGKNGAAHPLYDQVFNTIDIQQYYNGGGTTLKLATQNKKINQYAKMKKQADLTRPVLQNSAWDKDQLKNVRGEVFTKLDEATNCTFQPAVGKRATKATRKAMQDQKLNYAWVDDFLQQTQQLKVVVERMGYNFNKKYPMIYKYGVFRQCEDYFRRQDYQRCYKKLVETFDVEAIKKQFEPNYQPSKSQQIDGVSIFMSKKIDLSQSAVMNRPKENFSDRRTLEFLKQVHRLIKELEKKENEILIQKQALQKELQELQDQKLKSNRPSSQEKTKIVEPASLKLNQAEDRMKLKKISKNLMCPLGEKCPNHISGKWPQSALKSTIPLGAKCIYAHTYSELQFQKIQRSRSQYLRDRIKAIDKRIDQDFGSKSWNPGGNTIQLCLGCAAQRGGKGQCSDCWMRTENLKILEAYKIKAKEKQGKLEQKAVQILKNEQDKQNKKLKKTGLLQKANILFQKQRYIEAFQMISEAVQLVFQEMEEQKSDSQEKAQQLQQTMNLQIEYGNNKDRFIQIAQELKGNYGTSKNMTKTDPHIYAKVQMFGSKVGYLGDKILSANEFLNQQIEITYRKIDYKLGDRMQTLQMMKDTLEVLEGKNQQLNNFQIKKEHVAFKEQFCPQLKLYLRCKHDEDDIKDVKFQKVKACLNPECPYAHTPQELEIISKQQRASDVSQSMGNLERQLGKSNPPIKFIPPSSADKTIKSIEEMHKEKLLKEHESQEPKAHKTQSIKINNLIPCENDNQENDPLKSLPVQQQIQILQDLNREQQKQSIYNRQLDNVTKLPHERQICGKFKY